jgi:hypothetical protein
MADTELEQLMAWSEAAIKTCQLNSPENLV